MKPKMATSANQQSALGFNTALRTSAVGSSCSRLTPPRAGSSQQVCWAGSRRLAASLSRMRANGPRTGMSEDLLFFTGAGLHES